MLVGSSKLHSHLVKDIQFGISTSVSSFSLGIQTVWLHWGSIQSSTMIREWERQTRKLKYFSGNSSTRSNPDYPILKRTNLWTDLLLFYHSVFQHTKQIVEVARKGAPLLLEGEKADGSSTWKALPNIWRTAAIKYGERLAVLDPHHDPPTQLTFKQVQHPPCCSPYIKCDEECLYVHSYDIHMRLFQFVPISCIE